MAEWYYAQNDEQLGPVSAAALREMAVQGRLRPHDLIWREGMQRWAPAHKVRGLFPTGDDELGSPAASPAMPATCPSPAGEPHTNGAAAALAGEEETAIDALPLANPEESKLQLPMLGAPENSPAARGDSNELVVFEPTGPPPRAADGPVQKRPAEPVMDDVVSRTGDTKRLRIDAPGASMQRATRSAALFVQTFLWVSTLLVIVAGGVIYVVTLVLAREGSARLAASAVYATCVVAAYFLASATQRFSHVLSQWFVTDVEVQQRRTVRERNWKRFQ